MMLKAPPRTNKLPGGEVRIVTVSFVHLIQSLPNFSSMPDATLHELAPWADSNQPYCAYDIP